MTIQIHPKPHIHAKISLSGHVSKRTRKLKTWVYLRVRLASALGCIKYCYSRLGAIYAKCVSLDLNGLFTLGNFFFTCFPILLITHAFPG